MLAGPEVARIIKEFQNIVGGDVGDDLDNKHYEQSSGTQKSFIRDVKSLSSTMEEMGNPFLEDSVRH